MAPDPTTTIFLGCLAMVMASRYPMIFLPSWGRLGSCRLRAPVAMMMWSASTTCLLPSVSVTSTLRPARSLPSPMITSILFFFMRNWTPLDMPSATPRERETMPPKSTLGLDTLMP